MFWPSCFFNEKSGALSPSFSLSTLVTFCVTPSFLAISAIFIFLKFSIVWSCIHHLHNVDIAGSKSGLAITQIIIPLTDELLIEAQFFHFAQVLIKFLFPYFKGLCIMQSHLFQVHHGQLARTVNRTVDSCY